MGVGRRPPKAEFWGFLKGSLKSGEGRVAVRGDALGDGIRACNPHWRGDARGWQSIISMSMSKSCCICRVVVMPNWEDGSGRGCLANGGELSSSEDSAGVMVWVKRGAGFFRSDCEMVRTCLMVGEVRKGRLQDLCRICQQRCF